MCACYVCIYTAVKWTLGKCQIANVLNEYRFWAIWYYV